MEDTNILKQTIKGLRWSILLSTISFPASYLTLVILGRLSPEALGTYGVIGLLTNIILGIVFFGGNAVVIKFVPILPKDRVISFLLTYTGLACLIAGIFCLVAWFGPEYIGIYQNKFNINIHYKYLVLLAFILILQSIILAALRAFLNIKVSIFLYKIITFGTFGMIIVLFLCYREFFIENYTWLLWSIYLCLLTTSGILGLYFLLIQIGRLDFRGIGVFLPAGFWRFTIPLQLSSAVNFFQNNYDQIFVISLFGLKDYGQYLAVLNTIVVIHLISNVFLEVMLPSFSNMVALNNKALLKNTYYTTAKYFSFLFGTLSIFFIFKGNLLLSLFGKEYLHMETIMVILAVSIGISSMNGINSAVFSATGLTKYTLVLSIIEFIILFVLGLILSKGYGIIGIAIAKAISLTFRSILSTYIAMKYLNLDLDIPKAFWIEILIVMGGGTLALIYPPQGLLISMLLGVLLISLLFILGGIEEQDLKLVKRIVYGNNI